MPAKDNDHEIVIKCLKNAGWTILKEQEYMSIGSTPETHRRLYIDIKAQLEDGVIVLIEVKSLSRSPVHQLMELLGQYLVYRAALDYLMIDLPLYVAIPDNDYHEIFQHILGQEILSQYSIPLIVYDPLREEIQRWIPQL